MLPVQDDLSETFVALNDWPPATPVRTMITSKRFPLMKKVFKYVGYLLLGIMVLVAAALLYFQIKGVPAYQYDPPAAVLNLRVDTTAAMIARGAKIADMHCIQCHADAEGKLTGTPVKDVPAMFGELHSLNITQDRVNGIGAWTDGELYYFLRTGIRRDGSWAPPFMPKYNLLADEDVYAIIAWLRSGDWRLVPDTREYPPNQYNLLCKALANTLFVAPPCPRKPFAFRIRPIRSLSAGMWPMRCPTVISATRQMYFRWMI